MKKYVLLFSFIAMLGCQTVRPTKLNKIIFHTSVCFGRCPVHHMEIDGAGNVRLNTEFASMKKAQFDMNPDSSKIGYFAGKLDAKTFNDLSAEIERIGIDTLQSDKQLCCDGSLKTIIIYYNGSRKEIKTMFPKDNLNPLVTKLYEIANKTFPRSAGKFEIEGSDSSNSQ